MQNKTYYVELGEDRFRGTAAEIVRAMMAASFFVGDIDMDEYLDNMPAEIDHMTGEAVRITGSTPEGRAESFVREILRIGLARDLTADDGEL
ncbi:MAG: hypothetical protein PVH29_14195 [Candidatus Zixiibacteriota bacterium]